MPSIKLKHVVSFSSEDRTYPADNLLKDEHYRKWKCAQTGEKTAFVILQFDKAQEINSIDIGNEGSAFVEVLVNRSDTKNDFQVLLITSSFMSPTESKSASNLNRVRMFTQDKLVQSVAQEKWDLVKLVCSQPFNKTLQFGLTFVKFHAKGSNDNSPKVQAKLTLGAFSLKSDDDSEKKLKPGSLFATRNDKKDEQPLTGAAAIRAASNKAEETLLKGGVLSPVLKPTNTTSLKASVDEKKLKTNNAPSTSLNKSPKQSSTQSSNGKTPTTTASSSTTTKRSTSSKRSSSKTPTKTSNRKNSQDEKSAKRRKTSDSSSSKTKTTRNCPFDRIMGKVVFALSGFQNPFRGELREKALEMGAKYKPDWDSSCTHLVCAFVNTPKFMQVQGKGGRIVKKEWLLDCYNKKQKISWKKYRMSQSGPKDSTSEESDVDAPSTSQSNNKTSSSSVTASSNSEDEDKNSTLSETQPLSSEEMDTDDEIKKASPPKKPKIDDAYDVETDEEESDDTNHTQNELSDLPNYFKNYHFFLYGDFDAALRRLLVRYIVGFKGTIEDYMNDKVEFVITEKKWDENFDEALKENSKLVFVKPNWIFECRNRGQVVSHSAHVVSSM